MLQRHKENLATGQDTSSKCVTRELRMRSTFGNMGGSGLHDQLCLLRFRCYGLYMRRLQRTSYHYCLPSSMIRYCSLTYLLFGYRRLAAREGSVIVTVHPTLVRGYGSELLLQRGRIKGAAAEATVQ